MEAHRWKCHKMIKIISLNVFPAYHAGSLTNLSAIMTKAGTDYFREELSHWYKTLDFCRNEIPGFESRLIGLIQRNTTPETATTSETFLNQLAELHNKINLLQMEIKRLKGDPHSHEGNGSALVHPVLPQDTLRENMQAVERDFVETKYHCHRFLAEVYSAA